MKAEFDIVVDGQTYKAGEEIPDMGSIYCTDIKGKQRSYFGFKEDVAKLPKYNDLETGSSAMLVDKNGTGSTEVYKYHSLTKTWYKL